MICMELDWLCSIGEFEYLLDSSRSFFCEFGVRAFSVGSRSLCEFTWNLSSKVSVWAFGVSLGDADFHVSIDAFIPRLGGISFSSPLAACHRRRDSSPDESQNGREDNNPRSDITDADPKIYQNRDSLYQRTGRKKWERPQTRPRPQNYFYSSSSSEMEPQPHPREIRRDAALPRRQPWGISLQAPIDLQ